MNDSPRDESTRIIAGQSVSSPDVKPHPGTGAIVPPFGEPPRADDDDQKMIGQHLVARGIAHRDKLLIVAGLVAGTIVTVAIGLRFTGHRPAIQAAHEVYKPQFDVGMGSQEVIRSFTSKTAQEVTEMSRQIGDIAKTMDGLLKRQDHTEQFVRDALDKAKEVFERSSADKFKAMEEYTRAQHGTHVDARAQQIVDDFRRSLAEQHESPAQAKAHAAALLRAVGMSAEQVGNILAQTAQEAGRIAIGDIAEEPASAQEIESLPPWTRPYLAGIKDRLAVEALTVGRFYPEQTWPQIRDFLQSKEHARKSAIDEGLCRKIAMVERVRRQNLSQEMQEVVPLLLSMRDQRHLDRTDRLAIAGLVWNARTHLPSATSAGQLLSLCQVVAREVGAVASPAVDEAEFRPLDARTMPYALAVITQAVGTARQLGKDQAEQFDVAERALRNYLDTMRLTGTTEQTRQIILKALTAATASIPSPHLPKGDVQGDKDRGREKDRDQTVAPVIGKGQPAALRGGADGHLDEVGENQLFFGPLHLDPAAVAAGLLYALPGIMHANGIDAHLPAGVTALVAAMEQIPRIISTVLPNYLGKPLGGRSFLQDAIPQLIYALRMGESLAGIGIPVSPGGSDESSPAAILVRAAAIGAVYGPMIHDEVKAKSAAGPGIAQIEADPPLRKEVVRLLAQIPLEQPLSAAITAAQAVRPGRFPIPAKRFQDMADGLRHCEQQIPGLILAMHPLLGDDQQSTFEENVRMLLPLCAASHDDGHLGVAEIIALVEGDVLSYSDVFLAEGLVSKQCMEELIPRYAPAMIEEESAPASLIDLAMKIVPATVYQVWSQHHPALVRDHLEERAHALADEALPLVEHALVEQVVLSRVQPRIRRASVLADPEAIAKSWQHAQQRVRTLVGTPYTPMRIDAWATTLTDECRKILVGTGSAQGGPDSPMAQSRPAKGYWPAITMLIPLVGNQHVVGALAGTMSRQIVIPAETFANAHLQTGVDAEIGGHGNIPVMLQIDLEWIAPGDSRIVMHGCRLSGSANVMAGPQRVSIDLKQLSYVFPDGREINAEVKGYVADNLHGQYGVLGSYRWNTEKVLPLALVAGAGQGASSALKADSTTQIIGANSTTTIANPGAQLTQALYGGLAGGAGIMADYVKAVLTQIHPSVSVENGQRVSVVILDAVPLQIPEYEFPALLAASQDGFLP